MRGRPSFLNKARHSPPKLNQVLRNSIIIIVNDSFASSKLIKYNAEEGVRVMVTYGQVMID